MINKKLGTIPISFIVLLVLFVPTMSPSIEAVISVPQRISADTVIGSDTLLEGLELIAGEGDALIGQYYQYSGEKVFPLDPSTDPFDDLTLMYIISSKQDNWHQYWPRSIWEFRDGATVLLQFDLEMEDALDEAALIIPELNTWLNTTLDVLYGAEVEGKTTLFYWGYLTAEQHGDFITNEFYDILSPGGFTDFVSADIVDEAPVSVVGTGMVLSEKSVWEPVAVCAFILDNAIDIIGETYTMSIESAFDYDGDIQGSPDALISAINFVLPYVANVYDITPTDNLYPELTGKYEWLVKAGVIINRSYDDIYVTYNMNVEELETFPQISADVSIDIAALQSSTDPQLNNTIIMENSGTEIAYNTTFVWDLGEKPTSEEITVFDNDKYLFNTTVNVYYNVFTGELSNDPYINIDYTSKDGSVFNLSTKYTGWFTYHNGTLVQPQTFLNSSTNQYELLFEETLHSVYITKEMLNFVYSDNIFETTLENGNYALIGYIDQLSPESSEEFWWAIDNLPASDDTIILLDGNLTNANISKGEYQWFNDTGFYYLQLNYTIYDATSEHTNFTNVKDYIVDAMVEEGGDLRFPGLAEFIPGVQFVYSDSASREYFGFSNALNVQLYDDEAVLKATVSLNSSIYRIDGVAEINVTIQNIGDATATNIQAMGLHAMVNSDWQIVDIQPFSEKDTIPDLASGESYTHTWYRNVSTFLGIHPVAVLIDYTTEEDVSDTYPFGETNITNQFSNLINAIVLPKLDRAGEDEPSYPTPEINTSVTWRNINGFDNISIGDTIEIRTEITNDGDEATTIKAFSYFPTRMAHIDMTNVYAGYNFKLTDISGNVLTGYDQGFAFDHADWPISVAAVAGVHLAPGATVILYYRIVIDNLTHAIIPPVHVEYDSRYPMAGTSGMDSSQSNSAGDPASRISDLESMGIDSHNMNFRISVGDKDSASGSSWTSYSSPTTLSAFAAVAPVDTTDPTTNPTELPTESSITSVGTSEASVSGYTTLTSSNVITFTNFIKNNMGLMTVVLAVPIMALVVRDRRKRQ